MKRQLLIITLFVLLNSCSKKEKDFDSFEYSYSGTFSTVFSIKFTENDTIFLREHWNAGERSDNIKFPKAEKNYFAILTKEQRNQLGDLLKKIDLKKINSHYFENYADGDAYQLIIKKDTMKKTVFVHSYNVPKELDTLSNWIYKTKENLKLIETNRKLYFRSLKELLPPPPPLPKVIYNIK
ncbi:hypothetical protein D3C86_855230 [compost metagenome]